MAARRRSPRTAVPGADWKRTIQVSASMPASAISFPGSFSQLEREIEVRIGEENLAFYRAAQYLPISRSSAASTFNVTPHKAGPYFSKIACFCFTEQVLQARRGDRHAGLVFRRPGHPGRCGTRAISKPITLSYTFFMLEDETEEFGRDRRRGRNDLRHEPAVADRATTTRVDRPFAVGNGQQLLTRRARRRRDGLAVRCSRPRRPSPRRQSRLPSGQSQSLGRLSAALSAVVLVTGLLVLYA